MTRCPECSARVLGARDLELWDHIFCQVCGAELEVVSIAPLDLEGVYDFDDEELLIEDEAWDEEEIESW
jgi:lysine biosynthesis protein LysW